MGFKKTNGFEIVGAQFIVPVFCNPIHSPRSLLNRNPFGPSTSNIISFVITAHLFCHGN